MGYDFTAIENKWQKYWDEHKTFHAENDYSKPKFYALVEFPYPSGQGLHIGHPRPYTAMDIVSRKRRLQGYNVLFPMGWDAFGLPTENFAIKNKIHPAIVTKNNVARFKAQLKSLGLSFDWDREINTTDPDYFKWTQWIFLKLFKAGLAYKKEMNVNWCTSCKVVLANEEVVNGKCERCGGEVVHKVKSQWMLKITEYAQKLIDDLDSVDYFEKIKTAQKNWIGRSTGAEVDFTTTAGDMLTIYTTRPDTLFGATYMVISPEHPMIEKWADKLQNLEEIKAYQEQAARKLGKSRSALANILRLLTLPDSVLELLKSGFITIGHAKVVLGLPTPELQAEAAQMIADNQLNVRQAEALCKKLAKPAKEPAAPPLPSALPVEVEESLKQALGSEVRVAYHDGKGKLTVHFYSDDQLKAFANLLGQYSVE